MWQIQKGVPQLLGYVSKTLPPACKNYSVTELEMFSLLINIYSWEFLVHDTEFDVAVDHQALVYIIKGKTAPELLNVLQGYWKNCPNTLSTCIM